MSCPSGAYIPIPLNIHLSQKPASLPLLAVRATTPQLTFELWHACATLFASNRASLYFNHAYRAAKIPVQAPCRILRRPSLHAKPFTYCEIFSFYHKGGQNKACRNMYIHISTYLHISHNNKHIPPSVNINRNVAQRSENLRIDATHSLHAKCPSKPPFGPA